MTALTALILLNANGGETSLLTPLTNLYIIVPVLAGSLCLKDRVTFIKGLGIALAIAACLMFGFGGGSGASAQGGLVNMLCFTAIFLGTVDSPRRARTLMQFLLTHINRGGGGQVGVYARRWSSCSPRGRRRPWRPATAQTCSVSS